MRELLGGQGIVLTRGSRIGASFKSGGLLDLEEFSYKSSAYNYGSGGMIGNYNRPKYRDIFFDPDP